MKILYILHEFFPIHYTGTARVAFNLAKQMQKMGHEVNVLTYGLDETENLTTFGNIVYKKYNYDSVPVTSFRDKIITPEINVHIFNTHIEKDIKKLIESGNLDDVDIIHIIHPLRTGIVAKIFKEKGIPIILTLTDYWTICPRVQLLKSNYSICNGPDPVDKCTSECGYGAAEMSNRCKDAPKLFDLAEIITVPSNLVKHIFKKNGFSDEKIKVVNHGLDYKHFNKINTKIYSKNENVTFGYVGPILKHKGIHVLIDAFLKVKQKQIKLKIYGTHLHEKKYYNDLKKRAKNDERIVFVGEFDYNNLSNIYSGIDVAIFPSIWYETYCLALTESLAHNVPVIASNTLGSALEFIDNGHNGFIFKTGDTDDLVKIIEKITENPLIINNLKENMVYPLQIEEEALRYANMYHAL